MQEPRVVSIVGFGGLGKTILANEVFVKLGEDFDCKAFVSVSQRPDMMMLLKSLAAQMLGPLVDTSDINGLINKQNVSTRQKVVNYCFLRVCILCICVHIFFVGGGSLLDLC